MNTVAELINELKNLELPIDEGFNVIEFKESFIGKTKDNELVFVSKSESHNGRSISQKTNHLLLGINKKYKVYKDNKAIEKYFNIVICFSHDENIRLVFLQMINVYIEENKLSNTPIKNFFDAMKSLFSDKTKLPYNSLQGLYGELLFMHFLNENRIDITKYWQFKDKRTFDFSLSDKHKIEIKTTTRQDRKHNFKHEQLMTDIYDTWIVSILLRRDDSGLSLYTLAEKIKNENPSNFSLHIKITSLLQKITNEDLEDIKFNENYSLENIGYYRVHDVPKFEGKQPDGVTNAEYTSDLSNVLKRDFAEIREWIEENLD
ncbi:PD-(D/E)XK motif protein [Mycoplasmopsis agassizii]|uniref:PD-(D/E)XK motif protein n=1 Tax=Mycoplasmopsis agassizii TaxID=33922 RepID=A0ABX4H5B0_9BACT|nr:PD-(D/E)XK motif protein [Mycoplasmopsis agassizii]PAF55083.1 PD-(D/E)XK motif protein [Mycoplasmopsis agassizii]SMC19144.1 Putative PD-(D/E)XK family member [Mycoplasmopsis agassizii]